MYASIMGSATAGAGGATTTLEGGAGIGLTEELLFKFLFL